MQLHNHRDKHFYLTEKSVCKPMNTRMVKREDETVFVVSK